jgi:LuxR family transcriptional regulator, maltose regulon positive regulatory protein
MTAMISDFSSRAHGKAKRPARPAGPVRPVRPARPARAAGSGGSVGEVRDLFAGPRPAQADRSVAGWSVANRSAAGWSAADRSVAELPAAAVLTPLLDVLRAHQVWVVAAFLLGTIARDALGDPYAAGQALQRALDLAEPEQMLFPFLIDSSPEPDPDFVPGDEGAGRQHEALTHGETRVLHYLPTNLSAREIADELYLSVNTVKTHQRHLYQKLGARSRTQAVEQARAFGLLASSARRR